MFVPKTKTWIIISLLYFSVLKVEIFQMSGSCYWFQNMQRNGGIDQSKKINTFTFRPIA
jgi:hypothetical protein